MAFPQTWLLHAWLWLQYEGMQEGQTVTHSYLFQFRRDLKSKSLLDMTFRSQRPWPLTLSSVSVHLIPGSKWIFLPKFKCWRGTTFLRMGHTYRHKSSLPNEFSAEDPSSHVCSAVIRSTFKFALEYVTFPAAVADTYIKIKCKKQSSVCHTGILLDPILEMGGPTALCMFEPLSLQKGCRSMSHLLRSQWCIMRHWLLLTIVRR